jgi:erythrocyte band 7 integral membrane protein
MTAILVFIIAGMIAVLLMSVRVIAEYERAVIFRLGRVLHEPKGPGLFV